MAQQESWVDLTIKESSGQSQRLQKRIASYGAGTDHVEFEIHLVSNLDGIDEGSAPFTGTFVRRGTGSDPSGFLNYLLRAHGAKGLYVSMPRIDPLPFAATLVQELHTIRTQDSEMLERYSAWELGPAACSLEEGWAEWRRVLISIRGSGAKLGRGCTTSIAYQPAG